MPKASYVYRFKLKKNLSIPEGIAPSQWLEHFPKYISRSFLQFKIEPLSFPRIGKNNFSNTSQALFKIRAKKCWLLAASQITFISSLECGRRAVCPIWSGKSKSPQLDLSKIKDLQSSILVGKKVTVHFPMVTRRLTRS